MHEEGFRRWPVRPTLVCSQDAAFVRTFLAEVKAGQRPPAALGRQPRLSRCSSRFERSTGTRADQLLITGRHERSRSRIDFSRARSLRFARFIAPAIAGATMVPNPDGRPRLRSSTIVAPLGVSENL
jgi:hypothetical protein